MEFIPVKSFDSYITANIWLGKLQDAGIVCRLADEYTVTIDPILTNAVGGIKLCVDRRQLQQANDLIQAFEQQSRVTQRCPSCHSLNVQYIARPGPANWFSAIASWLLGNYAVTGRQVYHCFDCGKEFEELENAELNSLANS